MNMGYACAGQILKNLQAGGPRYAVAVFTCGNSGQARSYVFS